MFKRFSAFILVFVVLFFCGVLQGELAYDWNGGYNYCRITGNYGSSLWLGNIFQADENVTEAV